MLSYLWYRHVHFRAEFEKDNRVDEFAETYMSSNLRRIKAKGDRLREQLRSTRSDRLQWHDSRDKLEREARLLQDAEFHSVATKYRRLGMILILIFLAESGLNFFTALIAIPAVGILAGGLGTLLRLAAAVIITVIGIVAADQFFDEIFPSRKYGEDHEEATEARRRRTNWGRVCLWGVLLLGTEFMIYHFGLVRVKDIAGGHVDPDIAKSVIILSMIVPVVGGGIAWELSTIRDAYKNRLRFDRYVRRIGRADTAIETLSEKENGYMQQQTIAYWDTFRQLKSFKEYYNRKQGVETAPLLPEHEYAKDYTSFYGETLLRYNQHKERQDALGKLKLDSETVGVVGRKIGQDHA